MKDLTLRAPHSRPRAVVLTRVLLVLTLAVTAAFYFVAIRQNLPYYYEVDEHTIVERVAKMVTRGDLNPGWFGHPSSTLFYPLLLLTWLANVLLFGGPLFGPDPEFFKTTFYDYMPLFYMLGRVVTMGYGLMAVPLCYLIGRRLFGAKVAVVGLWLVLTYPIIMAYVQVVRSDSAGLFFALLSVWFTLRYYERMTTRDRLLAGAAVGLAIGSRYFMAFFVLPLTAVEVVRLWRLRGARQLCRRELLLAAGGPLAVGIAFALCSPFFVLDLPTALSDIRREARTYQLGGDGLSPLGNFTWYLSYALPWSVTWPHLALAVAGAALAFWQRRLLPAVTATGVLLYVVAVSVHPLHMQRWILQTLPFVALLAASALVWMQEAVTARLHRARGASAAFLGILLAAILTLPVYDLVLFTIRQANYSTQVQAYHWALANLPDGAQVRQDSWALPESGRYNINRTSRGLYVYSPERSVFGEEVLESHQKQGVQFIITTSETGRRIFAEPERYAVEIASYERLAANHKLMAEFVASPVRPGTEQTANLPAGRGGAGGGPIIRIYQLLP